METVSSSPLRASAPLQSQTPIFPCPAPHRGDNPPGLRGASASVSASNPQHNISRLCIKFALDPGTLQYLDLFVECSAFGDFESVHCENFSTFSVHFRGPEKAKPLSAMLKGV